MKHTLVLLLLLRAALTSGCSFSIPAATPSPAAPWPTPEPQVGGETESPSRPVIVDTDMAVDDWMAILYLLQRPDIQVVAITVTGAGETHCEPGIRNALGLVALAGVQPIPVACGRDTPLKGNHAFPAGWRESADSMLGLSLPSGQNPTTQTAALDLLTTLIRASSEKVSLLTLGPLTNLADLFQAAPDTIDKIEMVYVMGGAVHVPGNMDVAGIPNQAAEWNIYVDPHAANLVFASGAPVTLVPLDATNQVPLTISFFQALGSDRETPEATFVYQILTQMTGLIDAGNYYFWDPLAAGIMVDETLGSYELDNLCVVEKEGAQSGRTKIDPSCPAVRVTNDADGQRFTLDFIDTLNGRAKWMNVSPP